jgi:hypothetical protein
LTNTASCAICGSSSICSYFFISYYLDFWVQRYT